MEDEEDLEIIRADKLFTHTLECGCLVADDSGTPNSPNGDSGMISCCAEYGDMTKEEDRKHLELHEKCIKEFFDTYDNFGNKRVN